ncbi:MAG TPA: hypothetical protein VK801_20120 [Caulobacteraceae bacterium]|jgi:hypothetical protein|nr:hypothetical protein [Caulobacteraceae bacterium]
MKALLPAFSIVIAVVIAGAAGFVQAATPDACASTSSDHPGGYPSFCSIPLPPTDVRTAAEFKTAVVDARVAGRSLTRATARMHWSLTPGETEAFAAQARAQATPPPPLTPPGEAEEFARRAREEATPPPRPH